MCLKRSYMKAGEIGIDYCFGLTTVGKGMFEPEPLIEERITRERRQQGVQTIDKLPRCVNSKREFVAYTNTYGKHQDFPRRALSVEGSAGSADRYPVWYGSL